METLEIMPVRVKVTAILKKAILSGEYQKGEELSLTDISNKLGVSRTPVREAFQALEAEGLIKLRMNKGALVLGVDEKFIKDHYEVRALLESEAAQKATINKMDVTALLEETINAREKQSFTDKEYYEDLNQRIHMAIWKAADNERLYSFLMSLWNGPSIGKTTVANDHYKISTDEHIATLEAIKAGDAERAREIMKKHITRSMENMLAGLRK